MNAPAAHDAIEFVYREARILDEKRYDEWLELFTADAFYWMPLTRGQQDPELETSLFYEDALLRKVRIERLKRPRAFSQNPPSYCIHVLQRPEVESQADGVTLVRTPFAYFESQLDTQVALAGVAWHHVVSTPDGLRMKHKKVELLNCDAALPSIQLFL